MYQRITKDVWMIMGRCGNVLTVIDEFAEYDDAVDGIRILRLTKPSWSLWVKVKRVKI